MDRTVIVVAHVNHSWADAQKKDTVLFVLRTEFGGYHVHRHLARAIQSGAVNVIFVHPIHVTHTTRDCHYLLDLPLEDLWHEQVIEVDVGQDIDVHQFVKLLRKLFWIRSPNRLALLAHWPDFMVQMQEV